MSLKNHKQQAKCQKYELKFLVFSLALLSGAYFCGLSWDILSMHVIFILLSLWWLNISSGTIVIQPSSWSTSNKSTSFHSHLLVRVWRNRTSFTGNIVLHCSCNLAQSRKKSPHADMVWAMMRFTRPRPCVENTPNVDRQHCNPNICIYIYFGCHRLFGVKCTSTHAYICYVLLCTNRLPNLSSEFNAATEPLYHSPTFGSVRAYAFTYTSIAAHSHTSHNQYAHIYVGADTPAFNLFPTICETNQIEYTHSRSAFTDTDERTLVNTSLGSSFVFSFSRAHTPPCSHGLASRNMTMSFSHGLAHPIKKDDAQKVHSDTHTQMVLIYKGFCVLLMHLAVEFVVNVHQLNGNRPRQRRFLTMWSYDNRRGPLRITLALWESRHDHGISFYFSLDKLEEPDFRQWSSTA